MHLFELNPRVNRIFMPGDLFPVFDQEFPSVSAPWEFRTLTSRYNSLGSEGEGTEFGEAHLHPYPLERIWGD